MKQTKVHQHNVEKKWYVVDATDLVLGRMSTQVADVLRGKMKPTFNLHQDNGDFVIIVNAEKIKLTGNKLNNKMYYNHSGYRGGLRKRSAKVMIERYPEEMVKRSIKGMIPHNTLGSAIVKKLFIYTGPEHPHAAQEPTKLEIKYK